MSRIPAFDRPPRIALLAGSGALLSIVEATLQSRMQSGRMSGSSVGPSLGVNRIASIDEAIRHVTNHPCDLLIVSDWPQAERPDLLDVRGRRVRLTTAREMLEVLTGRSDVRLGELEAAIESIERREASRWWPATKRTVDIALVIVLSVIALPVSGLIAALLWWCGSTPILDRATMVGHQGQHFRWLRFPAGSTSDSQSTQGSLRSGLLRWLTRAIKTSHMYLAPSLWNVLRGEMAFVGPKPQPESWYESHPDAWRIRCRVKPGVISLAQTRFSYTDSERDQHLALEYDVFYIKNASLWLDARVLLMALSIFARDALRVLGSAIRWLVLLGWRPLMQTLQPRVTSPRFAAVPMPDVPTELRETLQPCLIVGAGSAGRQLADTLRQHLDHGYWPIGYVDDDIDKIGRRVQGLPVLATTQGMDAIVEREHVESIIIAIPSASALDHQRVEELARQTGVEVLSIPSLATMLHGAPISQLRKVVPTDLLGRPTVDPDPSQWSPFLDNKTVLVTGAAGSIGREVVRQLARSTASTILMLDVNESDIFDLQHEIAALDSTITTVPVVASVTNTQRLREVFARYRPRIVFHAAAYKHVPMMEEYPGEAIMVNTLGTYEIATVAADAGVERFVMVSTDKAVRPSNVMGATKRLAEVIVQAISHERGMSACSVRFGNVLGSRGSVIPIFERQIAAGGPVTVTDKRMMRYFMTIPEAAGLIIQAGAFGDERVIYMLDMGEEVSILSLAERVIRMHGYRPDIDIKIEFTGLRPGEKLRESLALDFEHTRSTSHPKIRILEEQRAQASEVSVHDIVQQLRQLIASDEKPHIRQEVAELVARIDGDAPRPSNGMASAHGSVVGARNHRHA